MESMLCLTEPQLFDVFLKAAVALVYEYQAYASFVDVNGLEVTFVYYEEAGMYCTSDLPDPGEPV